MTASEEELTSVLLKLNDEGIDIHIHVVCDRAFRTCCNAVENAKKICGEKWGCLLYTSWIDAVLPPAAMGPIVALIGLELAGSAASNGGIISSEGLSLIHI